MILNPPNIDGTVRPRGWVERLLPDVVKAPNRIDEPYPSTATYRLDQKVLGVLMIAALVPRVVMALLIPTVCSDGTVYIAAAEAIERHDLSFRSGYALNLYPIVLAMLHSLGLSWIAAGKLWGVTCSVLVVLPLYGWIRRQFDDRTAKFACFLYAGHPKLIEWAPELIREQTFWLLFTTGLYCGWRAVTEVRFTYYSAAAVALAAATFTRFEGLFLIVPLLYWTGARFFALRAGRVRLVRSFGLMFVVVPCALLTVKLTILRTTELSDCLNSAPLARVTGLVNEFFGTVDSSISAFEREHFGIRPGAFSSITLGRTLRVIARGLTPTYAVLLLFGLLTQGRRSLASDRLPALITAFVTIAAIWIHTWYSGLASSRYILTVVLLSAGTAAAGMLDLSRAISRAAAEANAQSRTRIVAALTAVVLTVGCCEAFRTNYDGRLDRAELGLWLRNCYGSDQVIYGCDEQLDLIAYYAGARCIRLPMNRAASQIAGEVKQVRPGIVVISNPPLPPASCRALTDSAAQLGMTRLEVPASSERRPIVMTALEAHGGSVR